MKAVEVEALSLSIGGELILRGVSCSVEKGRVLCVVGPNGAGKSTLLKCIGGLIRTWRGEVNLLGDNLLSLSRREIARRIAWVRQGAEEGLFYTVRQFAAMSRFAHRPVWSGESDEEKAVIEKALDSAGVSAFAERRLSTLSGGERQRAFIAAALAQETEILFLDEPTSFLDYRRQGETLELVKRLNQQEGKTIVMVTHDINLAARVADEIIAIKGGRLIWRGTPHELYSAALLEQIYGAEFSFLRGGEDALPYAVPCGYAR